MRLTFEALRLEDIFDQMAITLGERIKDGGGHEKQALVEMVKDRDAKINQVEARRDGLLLDVRNLQARIKELEGHLAHAVGTKDLELVEPLTKMPDSLKQAIANADPLGRKQRVSSTLLDDDVDKASKPPKDMVEARRYPTGYWRLSEIQFRDMRNTDVKRFGQMPNGDWVVVIT